MLAYLATLGWLNASCSLWLLEIAAQLQSIFHWWGGSETGSHNSQFDKEVSPCLCPPPFFFFFFKAVEVTPEVTSVRGCGLKFGCLLDSLVVVPNVTLPLLPPLIQLFCREFPLRAGAISQNGILCDMTSQKSTPAKPRGHSHDWWRRSQCLCAICPHSSAARLSGQTKQWETTSVTLHLGGPVPLVQKNQNKIRHGQTEALISGRAAEFYFALLNEMLELGHVAHRVWVSRWQTNSCQSPVAEVSFR